MQILIVDDHFYNRELLRFILEDAGHSCLEAENGLVAIEQFEADDSIDLILMDVNMPKMDGITATQKIVESKHERYVTIIFVTALDNTEVLVQCLNAGGDDFVPKPINEQVLLSKVNAHVRNQGTYNKLLLAHDELSNHQQVMDREHSIVEHVFTNGIDRAATRCKNINAYTSPMSMFNGDLVLTAPSPAGGEYVFIGDFTGHGLSAAIGSLPVTSIFFTYVARQASVSEIATEVNTQLNSLLPMGMFCCATIFHLDKTGTGLTIWSGGMNDAIYVSQDQDLTLLPGDHMPLGIHTPCEFDDSMQIHDLEVGGHLYIYTDGVNEAKNAENEEFGEKRIEHILTKHSTGRIKALVDAVHDFQGCSKAQDDDISIVEAFCRPLVHLSKADGNSVDVSADYHAAECFPWSLNITLESEDLRRTDTIAQTVSFLGSIQGVELHQDKLFTIVSELYNNALEHGVLRLDSSLKNSPEGFERYYRLREERLAAIVKDSIEVSIEYIRGTPNRIRISLTDSGDGFDFEKKQRELDANDDSHGRGLHLLNSLCSELAYGNQGKTVTAYYDFT